MNTGVCIGGPKAGRRVMIPCNINTLKHYTNSIRLGAGSYIGHVEVSIWTHEDNEIRARREEIQDKLRRRLSLLLENDESCQDLLRQASALFPPGPKA